MVGTSAALMPLRLLALGDSLTQGVGDPTPGRAGFAGQMEGWVTHLARAVERSGRSVEVTNLARAGAQSSHVVDEQVPLMRATLRRRRVDVASCIVGVNDLCRVEFSIERFSHNYGRAVAALAARSTVVLTATIHQFDQPFPVPAHVRQRLHANIDATNAVIRSTGAAHGALVVDMAASELIRGDVRSVDRLHPNRYGHQLIAAEVLATLQRAGHLCDVPMVAAFPARRGAQDLAHVAWVGGYVHRIVTQRLRDSRSSQAADT